MTHDQTEALALADRIAVMRDGELVDVDAAERLYRRPPSRFTAWFLGGANLLPATVVELAGNGTASAPAHCGSPPASCFQRHCRRSAPLAAWCCC